MFLILDFISFSALQTNLSFFNELIFIFWNNFWLEIFLFQFLFIYIFFKFLNEINLYKLCFLLMFFITLSAIYLSFLQLELFACFLFINEFIIVIFFFCFFFKLNVLNKINYYSNKNITSYSTVYLLVFFIILLFLCLTISYNFNNDCYLSYFNLYKLQKSFILNDLSFFFYSFFQYYLYLYFLIAILLLLMTCYLIFIVCLYVYLKQLRTHYTFDLNLSSRENKNWKKIYINFWDSTKK